MGLDLLEFTLAIEESFAIYLPDADAVRRSEEHTSELQSQSNLVCRLLLEKKKRKNCTADAKHPPPRDDQRRGHHAVGCLDTHYTLLADANRDHHHDSVQRHITTTHDHAIT